MKRSAYFLLLMLMAVMVEPFGSWLARGRPTPAAQAIAGESLVASKPYQSLTVPLESGSFVLKDLRLARIGGSTRLSGKLINQTNRRWETISFALKAFDGNGEQLRGVERETIFSVNQLGKGKSARINSGYGVWLEGIPLSAIARLEVVALNNESRAAHQDSRRKLADIEE